MWIVLALLVVAVILWLVLQPRGDLIIRVRSGDVSFQGRVALSRRADLVEFFSTNFAATTSLTVSVDLPTRSRRLRIRIRGPISDGEKQLIRNYLTHNL